MCPGKNANQQVKRACTESTGTGPKLIQKSKFKMTRKCHTEAKPKYLADGNMRFFASLRTPEKRRFDI